MTAALLAQRMLDGLSDTARAEMEEVLAELSRGGQGDLVALFSALLDGQDLTTALNLPDGTVALLYAQAHARFNAGQLTDALGLFQALVVLAPKVKDHWLGLGICLRLSNSLAGARLAFAAARDLAADCPAVTYHLAELCLAEDKQDQARALMQEFAAFEDSSLKQTILPEARRLVTAIELRTGA